MQLAAADNVEVPRLDRERTAGCGYYAKQSQTRQPSSTPPN